MLAYNYLKENPQLLDKQMKYDWAGLFTDPNTPFSVKEELKELVLIAPEPTDALLFWHQHFVMYRLLENDKAEIEDSVWQSHWLEQLYSVIQMAGISQKTADICFNVIRSLDEVSIGVKLTLEEVTNVVEQYIKYHSASVPISEAIIDVITGIGWQQYSRIDKYARTLLQHCSLKMLRGLNDRSRLRDVFDLIQDSGCADNYVFNSINEIQKIHDERTERETQALLKTCTGKQYKYHEHFIEIVAQCGMFLPLGPASLVERGRQHNNCVGTYDDRHVSMSNKPIRLFFSKTATLELHFELAHNRVVSTTVNQYKGKHNKNVDADEQVTELRIRLTGLPIEELKVERISE